MRSYQEMSEVQMEPRQFAIAAGFPESWKEEDLQRYIANRLQARGYKAELEVQCDGGRADIVTNWKAGFGEVTIIEVKKYFNRETLYNASGQAHSYKTSLPTRYPSSRKLVLMGMLTYQQSDQQSAINTAIYITKSTEAKVIFVNCEAEWIPDRVDVSFGRSRPDSLGALGNILMSILRWLFLLGSKSVKGGMRGVRATSRVRPSRRLIPRFMRDIPFAGWLAIAVVIYGVFVLPNQSKTNETNQKNYQSQSWQ